MNRTWLAAALLAAVWVAAPPAQAGPMGFKDSTMAMGDFGPNWREAWVNHAVTARDAFGVGTTWMRSDDKRHTREFAELTYTRLARRWNGEHSQANFWLVAGIGPVRGNDFAGSRTMVSPGMSFDWETTRLYFSSAVRFNRAEGIRHDYASVRAGFSFHEVDYDEVQPWFIVEARRMRGLSDETEITPLLRLIHNRYFIEAGINTQKQARFNFMYIF